MSQRSVPVLLVSGRDDVEAILAADPGSIGWLLTRVPSLEDPATAAQRWKLAVIDALTVPGAADLGARMREADSRVEFIVVSSDARELVEAVRAGAYQAVAWPCDPAELWDPVAACVKRLAPVAAPDRLGDFRFLERLAAGGMGEVHVAESPRFEGRVVVKMLQPALASLPEFAAMFRAEARVSSQLSHPNIARVLDHGEIDGRMFLALELVDGWDLLDAGRATAWRIPPRLAFHIAAEVAAALDHAHSRTDEAGAPLRIVHRDVNPPNILLSRDGRVLLSDFGVAKSAQDATQTQAGVIKGKAEYFSPEQIAGEPLDGRSDLFSLGAVLYLMLTGTHPFRGPSRFDTLRNVRNCAPERLSAFVTWLPDGTEAVVSRALAREKDDRYATGAEMERDLRRLAGARVPPEELADFLAAGMDERTRVAGLRASRSASTAGAIPELSGGARPTVSGERTMTREGPPPGEATVVREADTEATRLRPPGPAPAHALRAQAPSPSPPVTRWIATGLGAAGLIAVGLFAGAYDPAGSSRVAPPSPARTLAAASPAETPHATAHETTVATPSLLRATARSTPGAVPVIATRTPSPTATVPADRGTLTIWMPSGWAAISVDGRALGINAPRVGIDLPAGAHRVTLENPPARFRQDYDVVITANRELRLEASLP